MKNARTSWNAARLASERPLSKRKEHAPVGERLSSDVGDDFERGRFGDGEVSCCEDCGMHICACWQKPVQPAPTPVIGRYNPETGSVDIVPVTQPMTLFQAEQLAPRWSYLECETVNSTAEPEIVLLSIRDKRQNPPHLLYERVPVSMLVEAVVEITWKRLEQAADEADAKWFAAQQEKR